MVRSHKALARALAAAAATSSGSGPDNLFFANLGNSQSIQGQTRSVGPFSVQMLSNETHAIVTLNASTTAPSKIGYMAVGFGTTMGSSDMVVTWPSTDGSTWFVSARQSSGHSAPKPVTGANPFTYLPQLSTNSSSSSYSQVSFLRPLTLPSGFKSTALSRASGQSIIYAASTSRPSGTDGSATIVQHDDSTFGTSSLDLSVAIATSSTTGAATVAQATGAAVVASAPWTTYDNIIVLHALCGSLAWIVVAPAAVLVGRLARQYSGWVRIHSLLQTVLTTTLTVVAFALGVVAMNMQGAKHFAKPHTQLGLVIFLLLLAQVALGYYSHHKYDKDRTKRPVQNVAHIFLGISLLVVGYIQVWLGMKIYTRQAPPYVYAAWYISLAAFFLAYLISCGRVAMFRKQEGRSWGHSFFGLGRDSPAGEQLRSDSRQTLREKNGMSFFDQPVTEDDAPESLRESTVASREWAAQTNERMRQNQHVNGTIKPLTLPLMAGNSARPLQPAQSFRTTPPQQSSPVGAYPFSGPRAANGNPGLPSGPRDGAPIHNLYRPREPAAAWQQFQQQSELPYGGFSAR